VAVWLTAVSAALVRPVPVAADDTRWGADYFPNVTFTTQDGAEVRFFDDLIKGKIVAIDLIYTTCTYACPLETARLAQVQRLLGDRMGRDVFFYSITIDPEHDTPQVLKEYADRYQAGPGWLFLTGNKADIELVSKKLGLYTPPDPERNPDGHVPYLLVGNQVTGQWMRNSALDNARFLANTIGNWLNSWQTPNKDTLKSYASVPRLKLDQGQYMFSSHCSACHTVGGGDHIGPDLRGVTAARDRGWLTRIIVEPDKMIAEGDPTVVALREKFKQVRMPNLALGPDDAAAIIDYLEKASATAPATVAGTPAKEPAAATDVDLAAIVEPYLRIQQALHDDALDGVAGAARVIAEEAAKLGSAAESIHAAAAKFQPGADLKAARAAFGKLSDALVAMVKDGNGAVAEDVKTAYCPMAQRSWLQKGEIVQNPFYGRAMSECGRITSPTPTNSK